MVKTIGYNSFRYEKYSAPEDGSSRYAIVGYATIYQYYAYPDKIRPRISQVRIYSFPFGSSDQFPIFFRS